MIHNSFQNKGFTLIENLVAIAILGIIFGGTLVSFKNIRNTTSILAAADFIKTYLEKSRLATLALEDGTGWSVKINSGSLVWFKGSSYNPGEPSNKTLGLPAGTQVLSVALENSLDTVFFNGLTGTTSPGNVVLALSSDPASTKTIYINRSGAVYLADSAGVLKPAADYRHTHFNLGWSIQGASELKFVFSNPSQTEAVLMAPYFNSDSSSFDYTATTTVGGSEQILRVHTHTLTSSNTLLSVARDGMENTKAVQILIDGKSIVSYAAAGAATVGDFGGTMTAQ